MTPTEFTPGSALLGGALIGLATGLVLLLNGKIAGVSGVCGRILRPAPGDAWWRVLFLLGMVVGGGIMFWVYPPAAAFTPSASVATMALAGLLVGFGARTGGGCTSGHGVCGIARASVRGITGTVVFMAVAAGVVYVVRHVVSEGVL
ncbi:MAG: YeeE/YedE family protein [Planctomycetota bacterium]|jgi:uncharacterized membrane protein YedE/YeeE